MMRITFHEKNVRRAEKVQPAGRKVSMQAAMVPERSDIC